MKCNEFKDNLNAYIENDISDDMMMEMANHMCECEQCNKLYEEEMEIDNLFKKTFEIDGIQFKSSRSEIMEKIDKNKYKKSSIGQVEEKKESKVIFPRFKNAYKFIGTAAALLLILVITPNLRTDLDKADMEFNTEAKVNEKYGEDKKEDKAQPGVTSFAYDDQSDKEQGAVSADKRSGMTNKEETGHVNAATMNSQDKDNQITMIDESEEKSNIEQSKVEEIKNDSINSDKKTKSGFAMERSSDSNEIQNIIWEKSNDGRYELALNMDMTYTKSSLSKILLKDIKNNKVEEINLNNTNNISSLIKIESFDEDNLLIIASSNPQEKEGGDLYKLNIVSKEIELIVKCKDNEKIIDINKKDEGIEISMIRGEDGSSKFNELTGKMEDIYSEEANIKLYDKQNNLIEERKIDK